VVALYNGVVLVDPTNAEVGQALGVDVRPPERTYDVLIVGAGPAGLAAAVYGASEGLRTAVLEREAFGGQAGTSSLIRNYPGFPWGVSGVELAWRTYQQAWTFGTQFDPAVVDADALNLLDMLDALFQGTNQPHMDCMFQSARDDISAAPDKDHIALLGQTQDCFRGLLHKCPEGRMQAEHFIDRVCDSRNLVFRHVLGEVLGQIIVLQNFLRQVAVKNQPRIRFVRCMSLQVFGQFFGDDAGGLAGAVHAMVSELIERMPLIVQGAEASLVAEKRAAGHGHAP
jgi:hypothetical protein